MHQRLTLSLTIKFEGIETRFSRYNFVLMLTDFHIFFTARKRMDFPIKQAYRNFHHILYDRLCLI